MPLNTLTMGSYLYELYTYGLISPNSSGVKWLSQCSDEPYCVCSLPALAHARNGRTYDIFFSQCSDET